MNNQEDREFHGWHLDRKVPISIIVTLLIYGISGLWFIADIKRDVEVLKAQLTSQRERDERQDKVLGDGVIALRDQLLRLEQKLDRALFEHAPFGGAPVPRGHGGR